MCFFVSILAFFSLFQGFFYDSGKLWKVVQLNKLELEVPTNSSGLILVPGLVITYSQTLINHAVILSLPYIDETRNVGLVIEIFMDNIF